MPCNFGMLPFLKDARAVTIVLVIITWFFFSCAEERAFVDIVRPPPTRTILLPETKKGKIPKSYEVNGDRYYPLPSSHGFVQFGKASWYGKAFQGRPTASGEIFNMYAKSAAHKTLPLGAFVEVVNLLNKKSTIVRVNDRGPFVKGRIIDLSFAAAKDIDLIGKGVVDVKIVALGKEVGTLKSESGSKPLVELRDLMTGEFSVQVGAFHEKDNAVKLAGRLRILFAYVNIAKHIDKNNGILYRVQVSKSKTLKRAGKMEKKLEEMGFKEAFIVRL